MKKYCYKKEAGSSLISLMVSVGLLSLVLAGATKFIFNSSRDSYDLENRISNVDNIRRAFKLISKELRVAGSSLPLGQANFSATDVALGDSALAVLTTSNASQIVFRINENGITRFLTSSYTPSGASLVITLNDASNIFAQEDIYISNMSIGGNDGLRGTFTGVSVNTVTISSLYSSSAGATFGVGSILTPSVEVTYGNLNGEVTRSDSYGTVVLAPRALISFTYLDASGTALALPLTNASIANSLSAVRVNITSTAKNVQKNGATHVLTQSQVIGLRNLIISRF